MAPSKSLLNLAIIVALVSAKAIPEPTITAAPISERQIAQDLIGYYAFGSGYDSAECVSGSTWTASSTYGRCCATTKTCTAGDFITRCSGNNVVYGDGFSASCTASTYSLCNTDQIIQTLNDANPTFWIGCDDDGLQTFYYRTKPATATGTVTVTPTIKPTSTPPSSSPPTPPSPTQSSSTPGPTTIIITASQSPVSKPITKSKGFIAGVVAGPIALIIIIVLVAWIFCIKKKSKRAQDPALQQQVPIYNQPQTAPAPMQQQYQTAPLDQRYQSQPPDQRYSAAPTYSNASYQGPYQESTAQSPAVSSMGSPQTMYAEGKMVSPGHGTGETYFPPDAKTPTVSTTQAPYSHPPHSELQ